MFSPKLHSAPEKAPEQHRQSATSAGNRGGYRQKTQGNRSNSGCFFISEHIIYSCIVGILNIQSIRDKK